MYIATKEQFQSPILFGREGDDGISIEDFLMIDEFVVFWHDGVIEWMMVDWWIGLFGQSEELEMFFSLFIGTIIGLHQLNDGLVVRLGWVGIIVLHSIESEYNYPLSDNRYIRQLYFKNTKKNDYFYSKGSKGEMVEIWL